MWLATDGLLGMATSPIIDVFKLVVALCKKVAWKGERDLYTLVYRDRKSEGPDRG